MPELGPPISPQIAGALARFFRSGEGPSHSVLLAVFMDAGFHAEDPGSQVNKQTRVQRVVLAAGERPAQAQRLIEAALRCFATRGLHYTSMSDLLEEAGMSAGSVYTWFGSKDDIIEASYLGSGSSNADWMASVLEDDALAGIAEVLHTAAAMFDDPRWRLVSRVNIQLWGEALFNERVGKSFLGDFRTYRQLLADAARRAQRRGDLDAELDLEMVARVIWGIYLGMEAQKAWEPELDTRAYVETALRFPASLISDYGLEDRDDSKQPPGSTLWSQREGESRRR